MKVKNWERFQHYKNRRPPWIKLYHDIIDDMEFMTMPDASRALAPCIWVLASEYQSGSLPLDLGLFAFRFHSTEEKIYVAIKPLIEKGFLILENNELGLASGLLAERNQVATLETETEKYKPLKEPKGGGYLHSSGANGKMLPPPQFSQIDFDERDLRKLSAAENQLLKKLSAQVGVSDPITEEEFFTACCEMAGITVQRGLKLKELQRKWPTKTISD